MPLEKGNPVIFTKPESSILINDAPFEIPSIINNVAYELELAFRISKDCKNVFEGQALNYVDAVGLGVDFTAKDILNETRETKGPWALAKGFDGASPLSAFVPLSKFSQIDNISFTLELNGERVQDGHSSLMIFSLNEIIAYVSRFMTLNEGDVILSGTPAHGTGTVKEGDRLTAYLEDVKMIDFQVK